MRPAFGIYKDRGPGDRVLKGSGGSGSSGSSGVSEGSKRFQGVLKVGYQEFLRVTIMYSKESSIGRKQSVRSQPYVNV